MTTSTTTSMRALHARAREATRAAAAADDARVADEERGELEAAAARLRAEGARATLWATLTDRLEERVLEAARRGESHLDLLTYEASHAVDGFLALYLIRGPRMGDEPQPGLEGLSPLIKDLKNALKPFAVTHAWTKGTTTNAVRLSWF
jgi:hypothetical protein